MMVLLLAHDRNTSMGRFADDVLELDGSVADFEFPPQTVVDCSQNGIALGSSNVRDFHVRRQGAIF